MVAIVLIVSCSTPPTGLFSPRYNGKSLLTWVNKISPSSSEAGIGEIRPDEKEIATALQAMGTNCLPYLIARIKLKESMSEKMGFDFNPRLPFDESSREIELEQKRRQAAKGFCMLGPIATPAIPQLVPLLNDETVVVSVTCALVGIGTAAYPALFQALQHTNTNIRRSAALGISQHRGKGEFAIPALLAMLNDPDGKVRSAAAYTLGKINKQPEIVVPALIKGLSDPDPSKGASMAFGLYGYGKAAVPALPLLRELLTKTNLTYFQVEEIHRVIGSLSGPFLP